MDLRKLCDYVENKINGLRFAHRDVTVTWDECDNPNDITKPTIEITIARVPEGNHVSQREYNRTIAFQLFCFIPSNMYANRKELVIGTAESSLLVEKRLMSFYDDLIIDNVPYPGLETVDVFTSTMNNQAQDSTTGFVVTVFFSQTERDS